MWGSLVVVAVVGSVVLAQNRGDRYLPVIAVVASGIEALMVFGLLTLSLARYRVDVILPAILCVASAICWARATTKPAISAATAVLMVGAIQPRSRSASWRLTTTGCIAASSWR